MVAVPNEAVVEKNSTVLVASRVAIGTAGTVAKVVAVEQSESAASGSNPTGQTLILLSPDVAQSIE